MGEPAKQVKVVFFHRKPRPKVNFSVEILFQQIRNALPQEIDWEVKQLKYISNGLFKRIYICLEAAFTQKGINHVTGDINFIGILLKKKKTVLTILDVGFMKHPNALARALLKWFWITLPVRRAGIVTTISEATKTELLKYVKKDPDLIKVIYVPILPLYQKKVRPFNKSEPVILQVGTKFNKNVVRLVQALKGISCKLEIIGQIDEKLTNELTHAGINYQSFKNLSDAEIVERYIASDLVAFVSTYEGFGMPIVEANAVGRVVVTSNLLSMPEVAGNAAHLVDPFDVNSIRQGILKVIDDDIYRERLIHNGYENRKRFDVEAIARQYSAIYKSLSTN